jgi:hypothetical protein
MMKAFDQETTPELTNDRSTIHALVNFSFPLLQQALSHQLIKDPLVLKILYMAMRVKLPEYLK